MVETDEDFERTYLIQKLLEWKASGAGFATSRREGRASWGPAVNGFCASAQPGQGNQPQTGALPAAADLPDCEGDERDSPGKPTFHESFSCSVRPLLRLVARMSQTQWAATAGAQAHPAKSASDIQTFGAQVGADCALIRCDVLERIQTHACPPGCDANDANGCASLVISCTVRG
jgi:hypothetical protein